MIIHSKMIQSEKQSAKIFQPRVMAQVPNHFTKKTDSEAVPENAAEEKSDSKIDELMRAFDEERKNFHADFSAKSVKHSKVDISTLKDRFLKDGSFRSASISGFNAFLHALTVVTSMNKSPLVKKINHYSDKVAFFFTKIIAPFISFAISSKTAFENKKPIEGLIKAIPPMFLWAVGDANVDSVFGSCFGLNQPYDMVVDRLKEKNLINNNQSSMDNAKLVFKEFGSMLKDFVAGKLPWSKAGYIVNCGMILLGSLPILLFARGDRNTMFAKVLGFIRSSGGILGDALFMTQKANFHKFLVGILCSLGAMSNIAKRFVDSEILARIFIHLGAALDVAGYTVWNAWSDNKAPESQPAVT